MQLSKFVRKGAATFPVGYDGPPREYCFVLLPGLTMLALSSAIEPLRIANQIAQRELYRWRTLTEDGAPITCSNNLTVMPDGALDTLSREEAVFVCSGVEPLATLSPAVTQWLRRQAKFGAKIGGLCTGAFTLAKAGLLAGKRFTLHWENQPAFIESFPDLMPTLNLYEDDRDLMTAAGGSAATDLMLKIIEADHGSAFALVVSDMCLHGRGNASRTPQKSAQSVALGSRNQHLIAAVQIMQENLEEIVTLTEIAELVQVSRRQLERIFKTYVGMTPKKYYTDLRLARAYALFSETNMTVVEVAMATGFADASSLSRLFRGKYGGSPSTFKKNWAGGAAEQVAQE